MWNQIEFMFKFGGDRILWSLGSFIFLQKVIWMKEEYSSPKEDFKIQTYVNRLRNTSLIFSNLHDFFFIK
jgi:hypothetical protein